MSLTDQLNRMFKIPFQDYTGPIPKIVPALRENGRIFAGGDVILSQRVSVLTPDRQGKTDQEEINRWGRYYDLADLCVVFENIFKLQTGSGFLTGIWGIVEKDGKSYVAVDSESVNSAIEQGATQYFSKQFSVEETASYQDRDGNAKQAKVQNVILFPYDGISMAYTADQFLAINADSIDREKVIHGKDMNPDEIIEGKQVIHPAWAVYPAEIVAPLVEKLQNGFRFKGGDYKFDEMMGFHLPGTTSDNLGHGRALCVNRLNGRSRLFGYLNLGVVNSYVVGVDKNYAASGAKK